MNNGPTPSIKEIAGTLEKRRDRTLPYDRNTWTIQMYVWEPFSRIGPLIPYRFKESYSKFFGFAQGFLASLESHLVTQNRIRERGSPNGVRINGKQY